MPIFMKQSKKYDKGILLLHGFSGAPESMGPLCEKLRLAGYKVRCPHLRGHGTTLEDMRKASWRDWLMDASHEYDELEKDCVHVAVGGLSLGGLIALHLASKKGADAVVAISTPIRYRLDMLAHLSSFIRFSKKIRKWPTKSKYVKSEIIGYDGFPEAKIYDLDRVNSIARGSLRRIKCPILTIQSKKDELVKRVSMQMIMDSVSSKVNEGVLLENSPHAATVGPEADFIAQRVLEFLERNLVGEKHSLLDIFKHREQKQGAVSLT